MSDYKYIPLFSVKVQLLQHQFFFTLNLYINKPEKLYFFREIVFFNTRIFHVWL